MYCVCVVCCSAEYGGDNFVRGSGDASDMAKEQCKFIFSDNSILDSI